MTRVDRKKQTNASEGVFPSASRVYLYKKCEKKMMKKYLVEKPNQDALNLLRKCEGCSFSNGCFYFPSSESCLKLLKKYEGDN